jgi:hypothetical protein
MSPLATAIDELLVFVDKVCPANGPFVPLLGEVRQRFRDLDFAVWREANRAGLENKMPKGTGLSLFSLGRTKFPCNAATGANINPDDLKNWKQDLLLLREFAEEAAKKSIGRQSAGDADGVPHANLTPATDKPQTMPSTDPPAGGGETRQGEGGSPPATEKKHGRVPKNKAEILVADWLKKHAKEDPDAVTRDQIAAETGVSTGGVSGTAAFRAFDAERNKRRNSKVRTIPLSERMQAAVPADCARPDELAELIEEQEAERTEEERRSKRRHTPS